jgi:hypothetical protein
MTLQNTMLSVQFELKATPWLISAGTGLVVFVGFAGRIIGISLAQSVFENMIQKNLRHMVPGISEGYVAAVVGDATAVWNVIPDVSDSSSLLTTPPSSATLCLHITSSMLYSSMRC